MVKLSCLITLLTQELHLTKFGLHLSTPWEILKLSARKQFKIFPCRPWNHLLTYLCLMTATCIVIT